MDLYIEDLRENSEYNRTSYRDEEWKRWDDELVEDFSRWLNRAAKVLLITLGLVSAAVVIRLL
jgi:hypothetical protein